MMMMMINSLVLNSNLNTTIAAVEFFVRKWSVWPRPRALLVNLMLLRYSNYNVMISVVIIAVDVALSRHGLVSFRDDCFLTKAVV